MRTFRARKLARQPSAPDKEFGPTPYIPNMPTWGKRMYAICFDLDTETLQNLYHNSSWQNGYSDIARILARHGFNRQQGTVYFGDANVVNSVKCVLAVQDIAKECPWFRATVKDIRMLRIEEENDLMPAVGIPELPFGPPPPPPQMAAE
jgi:virulence-associated protein VapD